MKCLKKRTLFIVIVFFFNQQSKCQTINGVCFVSPSNANQFSNFEALKRINAKWVAITPYAFSKKNEAHVAYDYNKSWWGEQTGGVIVMIEQAKAGGLKIMLKPHVWVMGEGWCGQYDLKSEEEWRIWERDYAKYILTFAKIAQGYDLELLCIGTEYKMAATKRALFWKGLIKAVRKIYDGKVTYAANWDNYKNIPFWADLDFIGVDAYFPLSQIKNVDTAELKKNWKRVEGDLASFSEKNKKKIIFTEYGYKSTDFSAWNQWEIEGVRSNDKINISAQEKAYQSLFKNVWNKSWFGGGFLWKWYAQDSVSGGLENSDYTPQHKPVEKIIRKYYK